MKKKLKKWWARMGLKRRRKVKIVIEGESKSRELGKMYVTKKREREERASFYLPTHWVSYFFFQSIFGPFLSLFNDDLFVRDLKQPCIKYYYLLRAPLHLQQLVSLSLSPTTCLSLSLTSDQFERSHFSKWTTSRPRFPTHYLPLSLSIIFIFVKDEDDRKVTLFKREEKQVR